MPISFDSLERRLGRYAVPHLTLWLLGGQVLVLLLGIAGVLDVSRLQLQPALVLQGEWWRLLTFVFIPVGGLAINLGTLFGFLLLFYCGMAMEAYWGAFRYNSFIVVGVLLAVVAAFAGYALLPAGAATLAVLTNAFLIGSIFLAFALTHSQVTFLLLFVIPVRVLWLGLIVFALWWLPQLFFGALMEKCAVLAALLTLFSFFGGHAIASVRAQRRANAFSRESRQRQEEPFHRCIVCGATDVSAPDLRFAYKDGRGYCEHHWNQMDAADPADASVSVTVADTAGRAAASNATNATPPTPPT